VNIAPVWILGLVLGGCIVAGLCCAQDGDLASALLCFASAMAVAWGLGSQLAVWKDKDGP
jgi:hypothetical protein